MENLQEQIDDMQTINMDPSEMHAAQGGIQVSAQQKVRLKRVLDYQEDILKRKNHIEAVLGTVNAGLMNIAIHMDEVIELTLSTNPKTIDNVQKLLPAMQVYLQTTRQIDRLAQVELRVAANVKDKATEKAEEPIKPR